MEDQEALISGRHGREARIDDRRRQAIFQRQQKERRIDMLSHGKAKGNVGYAQHGFSSQLLPDPFYGLQGGHGPVLIRAHSHAQGIHQDILLLNTVGGRRLVNLFRHCKPSGRRFRDPVFIQAQGHHHASVLPHQREHRLHDLLLSVDRVDHRLSVIDPHGLLHGLYV